MKCELAGGGSVSGVARDISLGGAFLAVDGRPAFGETVVIELVIPGNATPLRVSGVVRWTDARGFGVQFGLLGARDTNVIVRLLNDLREQPVSSRPSASRV